jgi:hypothetical protein
MLTSCKMSQKPAPVSCGSASWRAHQSRLTVLQLAFVAILMTEPADFLGCVWAGRLLARAYSTFLVCRGGPDAATVTAGNLSVGYGAIREGWNWSGNQLTAHLHVTDI